MQTGWKVGVMAIDEDVWGGLGGMWKVVLQQEYDRLWQEATRV